MPTGKPAATAQGDVEKGIDWQSIINGTQIGLSAFDLATTRTKPPYYDFQPTELAYTRFEPINTKASERAFNLQREAIQNSNIPEQQKLALLSSNYGQMAEGVNQVDLTNYQNKLANDNRNVDRYYQARNTDIQRQEASNMKYVAESDRRNAQASMQRQAYVDNIMTVWRTHVNNRRDIGLVNQFSRNFDYNLNSQKVEYQAGQGVPLQGNPTNLEGFQQNKGIDPRFLNAEGRKAFGLDPN